MPAAESVWQRLWEYPFYQNALAAGLAVALLCSVLSVFVVLRRMAFIGQGISHAAFGGAGLALLLGLLGPNFAGPLARDLIIAAFCVATALLIGRIARQQRVGEDSAIGICLVAAMALGVILLNIRAALYERLAAAATLDSTSAGYTPSFHDLLFGNILSIPRQEVVLTWRWCWWAWC
jgi:zinc transport system permease protein